MRRKLRLKKSVLYVFMSICLLVAIYSSIKLFIWKDNVDKNHKINIEIRQNIVVDKDNNTKIDFKKLKEENPDTIAYIKVNNTNIDYVVVQGKDNSYYLTHNFKKTYNVAGWIFADYKNKFDGTDKNIVVYGHSTKDGSMFGTLNKTMKKEWQTDKNNLQIVFITENQENKYKVFSTYLTDVEEYYIKTNFYSDEEFNTFINTMKKRSNYNFGVDVSSDDTILTLSSCNYSGTKRYVLHAKLIK